MNCFKRGKTPAGVTCPCGAIIVSLFPTRRPKLRASSPPITTLNSPERKACKLPRLTWVATSETLPSSCGKIPRTKTPRKLSSYATIACAST